MNGGLKTEICYSLSVFNLVPKNFRCPNWVKSLADDPALDVPDFAQFMAGKFGCVCRFFGTEKSTYLCGCLPKIIWIESSLDLHFYAGWSP